MKINDFEKTLDRFGTNLDAWPAGLAGDGRTLLSQSPEASGTYATLLQIEALIAGSAPRIDPARAARVANRAIAEIRRLPQNAPMGFVERIRRTFALPAPRVALAMSLTAIGFVIGVAVGGTDNHRAEPSGLMMTASAEDVLF